MKKILQILELSQEEYDQMFYDMLLQWCESVTGTEKQLQLVLSNQPIIKWYQIEYRKKEIQFIKIAERYQESNTVSLRDLKRKYCDCIITMLNISPRPLVEATKPKEIAGQNISYGLGKLLNFNIN